MKKEISNRTALARVLIRFAGVYFAYLAFKKIGMIPYAIYIFTIIGTEVDFAEKTTLAAIIPGIMSCLLHAGISFYCLARGDWLITFLSKPKEIDPVDGGQ